MCTLIIVGNSEGQRRCDARCHDAITPTCDCVCGGRFHGKKTGSDELKESVQEFGHEMLTRLEAEGHDCQGLREALGLKAPRCQAKYKTTNGVVLQGETCRQDAALAVTIEGIKVPILFCVRHYNQWAKEPTSKRVKWSAVEVKYTAPEVGARG